MSPENEYALIKFGFREASKMQHPPPRQGFTDSKTTIGEWAVAHGFAKDLVYGVVSGRIKGTRGSAFAIKQKLLEVQNKTSAAYVAEGEQPD